MNVIDEVWILIAFWFCYVTKSLFNAIFQHSVKKIMKYDEWRGKNEMKKSKTYTTKWIDM